MKHHELADSSWRFIRLYKRVSAVIYSRLRPLYEEIQRIINSPE